MATTIRSLAALAALLGALAAPAAGEMPAKFKAGDAAPDFTLQDTEGRQVRLSSFSGKVVLLNFWSLRCGACLKELPFLNDLQKAYAGRGVAVLSVVTDGVDAATTKEIMKDVGAAPAYTVLVDPEFAVSDAYTNFMTPHTLVIDRKGIVRFVHTGFEPGTEKQYAEALDRALAR